MASVARVSKPAPDFSLPALDGKIQRLSEQLDRIVVLNFWSAHCPWAARVDESLAALIPSWPLEVVFWPIASNADETRDRIASAATERGLPLVLLDGDQAVADRYGAFTTPHFFVADQKGILRFAGAYDDVTFRQKSPTRSYLEDAVAALLDGRLPDPAEVPPYGCTLVRQGP
jgi:peroxiredoxin